MFLLLLACASAPSPEDSGVDDSADTDTDTGEPFECDGVGVAPRLDTIRTACGVCEEAFCIYLVELGRPMGLVELELRDTLPEDEPWTEFHEEFDPRESRPDAETRAITLARVETREEYVPDASTWVDVRDDAVVAATTWQISVYDREGAFVECVTWGSEPGSIEGDCPEG